VARIGKVFSSPKRLELIELLCQGEKTVETLARETSISVKLVSAHLRELRMAQLVKTERQGKNIYYRLADKSVADLWVQVHALAEDRLIELQIELQKIATQPNDLVPNDRETLMKRRAPRGSGRVGCSSNRGVSGDTSSICSLYSNRRTASSAFGATKGQADRCLLSWSLLSDGDRCSRAVAQGRF